ncbi:MAG: hypothetical protein K2K89_13375 [Ruminococcus sp.]|nr:hypothetical protein [Ruminococcus sp.]
MNESCFVSAPDTYGKCSRHTLRLRKPLIPKAPCGKNFRIISGACELSREPVLSMRLHPLRTIAFIKIYLIFCIKSIVYNVL